MHRGATTGRRIKKSNIRFAQLRAFFEGMGFSATREKKGWRIAHPATGTVFIFRPYRSNESVCAAKGFTAPIICTPEQLLGAKP
jgi:hypothetical protein